MPLTAHYTIAVFHHRRTEYKYCLRRPHLGKTTWPFSKRQSSFATYYQHPTHLTAQVLEILVESLQTTPRRYNLSYVVLVANNHKSSTHTSLPFQRLKAAVKRQVVSSKVLSCSIFQLNMHRAKYLPYWSIQAHTTLRFNFCAWYKLFVSTQSMSFCLDEGVL